MATTPALRGPAAAVVCLLVAARAGGVVVDRPKLARLLYLSDLRAVEIGLPPGSGVEWRWRPDGPYSVRLGETEKGLRDAEILRAEVGVDPFSGYRECRIHLAGDPDIEIDERFTEIVQQVVAQYGELSADQLRDLTYQTAPMQAALAEGHPEGRLDLGGGPPFPDLATGLGRLRQAAKRMPLPDDEPGGVDDLADEIDQLSDLRQAANEHLLEG